MDLLWILLLVPVVWFALAPVRAVGRVRRLPIGGLAIIAALLIAGWFAFTALTHEPSKAYVRGDLELRQMLY